ncbi:MAG TPA: hypothetical protein VHE30_01860 [Polyangiaceae bacterium]|nr:hypothetical protein [Polyangiaceae bacterium]
MNTLTCAELRAYPGVTFTEQLRNHDHEQRRETPRTDAVAPTARPAFPRKVAHGALTVGRRVDLGRFPGRDRVERMANYLRAHFPRTESWNEDALRDCAARLLSSTEIVG